MLPGLLDPFLVPAMLVLLFAHATLT